MRKVQNQKWTKENRRHFQSLRAAHFEVQTWKKIYLEYECIKQNIYDRKRAIKKKDALHKQQSKTSKNKYG